MQCQVISESVKIQQFRMQFIGTYSLIKPRTVYEECTAHMHMQTESAELFTIS